MGGHRKRDTVLGGKIVEILKCNIRRREKERETEREFVYGIDIREIFSMRSRLA